MEYNRKKPFQVIGDPTVELGEYNFFLVFTYITGKNMRLWN